MRAVIYFLLAVAVIVLLNIFCAPIHAEGVFVDGALTVRRHLPELPCKTYQIQDTSLTIQSWRLYDINVTKNPYASIMIGYEWRVSNKLKFSVALHHESSIATSKDMGIDDLRVGLRWSEK